MRIAMIGASGHGMAYCIPAKYDPEREFVAVAPGSIGEPVEPAVEALRKRGYEPAVYADYNELLEKEKPQVVVIDNFYAEHTPVLLAAFRCGCHVFCEKPAAATQEELDEICAAWKAAGTEFACMLNYRYEAPFYLAWKLIREGAIGTVRLLNAQKSYKLGTRPAFMQRMETYGGTLPWVGIHGIDWIQWMSGERFEAVSALQASAEAPNGICPQTTGLAQFRMSGGVMASLTVDYLNPASAKIHGDDRIRVVGTKGTVEVREGKVLLLNENGLQYPQPEPGPDFFGDFLGQVRGDAVCRLSAEDSFAASYAAAGAQRAADCGGWVEIGYPVK